MPYQYGIMTAIRRAASAISDDTTFVHECMKVPGIATIRIQTLHEQAFESVREHLVRAATRESIVFSAT